VADEKASRRGNAIVPYWRATASFKRMLGSTGSAPSLEELHLSLVPFGRSPGGKCAEVPSLTGLGILMQRVESVLARWELANHRNKCWFASIGVA